MISSLTQDLTLREDLMQEARVHLWLLEERRPGQETSWYLQSCKFRLQHYLAGGRSVDSGKRRLGQVFLAPNEEPPAEFFEQPGPEDGVLALVTARDLMSQLSRQLSRREQEILDCLFIGMGAREIARRIGISHPMVIKYRRRIAGLAMRLGETSPGPYPARRALAKGHQNGHQRLAQTSRLNGNGHHYRAGGRRLTQRLLLKGRPAPRLQGPRKSH